MNSPNPIVSNPESWTPESLQGMINGQVPEDFRLDYKSADALPNSKMPDKVKNEKKEEIGRDVTAFANSDGGVIIYGIREVAQEGRNIPGHFDPVNASEMSTETLTQIIASHSEPTLVGVRIFSVSVPAQDDPSKVCFVVVIPKGDTAHMAKDGRYYFRNENTRRMMRDWQVRDAMNRRTHPDVTLDMTILEPSYTPGHYGKQTFQIAVINVGKVIARNYCGVVHFPMSLNGALIHIDHEELSDFHIATVDGLQCFHWAFSNRLADPLFPGRRVTRNVKLTLAPQAKMTNAWNQPMEVPDSIHEIRIALFADEMPSRDFTYKLKRE